MRQFMAGVFSGGVILAVMFTLRMSVGYVFLPELAAQKLSTSIPLDVELLLVRLLWEYAKYVGLTLVLAGFLGFYGFLALLYGRWMRHAAPRRMWLKGLIFGVLAAGLVGTLLSPLSGAGLFAADGRLGPYSAGILVALHAVFSLLLHTSTVRIRRLERNPKPGAGQIGIRLPSRRIFVKTGAATSMALVLASYGIGFLFPRQDPSQSIMHTEVLHSSESANLPMMFQHRTLHDFVASEVTSNDDFFVVSQNVFNPPLAADSWSLLVDGNVSRQLRFSHDDLTSLP
ncbi:MAG: hypothetical protein ACE5PO_08270, partial [Candidatus Bathyarchaeia archaeon]